MLWVVSILCSIFMSLLGALFNQSSGFYLKVLCVV
uniref:Uncharacterized protein n=1 Tax=Rhizophora mucronata TaxID=61149 RepID=A0A2P2PTZ7_RHIMU